MRTTFLVGRRTPKAMEMVLVDEKVARATFPGPWQVRAVVRRADVPLPQPEANPTVH